jgi:ABC transporter transmembrane region
MNYSSSGTISHLCQHCLDGTLLKNRTVILVTHSVDICCKLETCEQVVRLEDGHIAKREHPSNVLDIVSMMTMEKNDADDNEDGAKLDKNEPDQILESEESTGVSQSAISWRVYATYLLAYGGIVYWAVYAFINIAAHVLMLAQSAWVGVWVNASDREQRLSYYFGVYSIIQIAGGAFLTLMYLYLIVGSIAASAKLHRRLAESIFKAPIRWFDATPLGRIVNRFAKGMSSLQFSRADMDTKCT